MKNKNNAIKKLVLTMSMVIGAACLTTKAQTIISGPTVRIPGITTPTVISAELPPHSPSTSHVGWEDANHHGVSGCRLLDNCPTLTVTTPGIYVAVAVDVTSTPNEPVNVSVTEIGRIEIPALAQSITVSGPNPLIETTTTTLCLNTNASAYINHITWLRNGTPDYPLACRNVVNPGIFVTSVTYSFGSESVTLATSPVTITPSSRAPLPSGLPYSYNPVTPSLLAISNRANFSQLSLFLNGNQVAANFPDTYVITPGTYYVMGILKSSGLAVMSGDIVVTQSDLPEPLINVTGGNILTYEDPQSKQLQVAQSYNAGYTWYKDGQVIPNATTASITINQVGRYSVQGCANYVATDHITRCQPSQDVQISGETIFVNRVKKKVAMVENVTSESQMDALPLAQKQVISTYLDDFARPVQSVDQASSPLGNDIVSFKKYDFMGREPKAFLPVVRPTSNGDFYYVPNSLTQPLNFYSQDNDHIANTAKPFAETVFENSPLNRVLRQGAPGEEWQVSTGHVNSITYANNLASDNILIWFSSSQGLTASSYYASGTLFVTQSIDADGNSSREFKDKSGQVVVSETTIETGKLRTYFVYDDMGRVTNVLPPLTIGALPNTLPVTIANDVLTRECYSYQYDTRSRMIIKNIPGGGSQYIVYDPWNRVALTQHANQRAHNKWSFNKYDALNRIIMTGEMTLQVDYDGAVQAVNNFYANISSNPSLRFEDSGGAVHGYTNRSLPVMSSENQAITVIYFDNYNFLSSFGSAYQFSPVSSIGLTTNFTRAQGLITGTKTVILGTTTYLKSAHYYDKRRQLIQVISDNHLGGIDAVSNNYDFLGKVVKGKAVHHGLQTVTIDREVEYDNRERISKVYHTVNNGPRILLVNHQYNELGQLIEKNLHSENGNTFLQSLDYDYNIRGWLSQVNPEETTEQNARYGDLYRFKLSYTTAASTGIADFHPRFNGNIAAFTEVRPINDDGGTPFIASFSYQYDQRNQLTQAKYYQLSNTNKSGTYDMPGITYDLNGNIKSLQRKGIIDGHPGVIDNLNYVYSGNQLLHVDDSGDQTKGYIKK